MMLGWAASFTVHVSAGLLRFERVPWAVLTFWVRPYTCTPRYTSFRRISRTADTSQVPPRGAGMPSRFNTRTILLYPAPPAYSSKIRSTIVASAGSMAKVTRITDWPARFTRPAGSGVSTRR